MSERVPVPSKSGVDLATLKLYLFVCPDCGAYHTDTANDYPLHSCCESAGHRKPVYAQCAIGKWLPRIDA